MALYGYARVSTADQDCTLQEHALRAAGCEVIRAEKVSATRREGRTELALLLEFLRRGDTLVVTRVDRLARSIKDLQDIVHLLKERGVTLRRPNSLSTRRARPGKPFWTCWGCSQNLKPTCVASGNWKGLPPPRPGACIADASPPLIPPRFSGCARRNT